MNDLSTVERKSLRDCERIIERGLTTFREVGEALCRIRDDRLYRESHPTFALYCEERWRFTKQRANQLIAAAAVAEQIDNQGCPPPESERVARELASVPDAERVEVLTEARQDGEPTAAKVKEIKERRDKRFDFPPTCPTCGGSEFDGDGDCIKCFEPAAGPGPVGHGGARHAHGEGAESQFTLSVALARLENAIVASIDGQNWPEADTPAAADVLCRLARELCKRQCE